MHAIVDVGCMWSTSLIVGWTSRQLQSIDGHQVNKRWLMDGLELWSAVCCYHQMQSIDAFIGRLVRVDLIGLQKTVGFNG